MAAFADAAFHFSFKIKIYLLFGTSSSASAISTNLYITGGPQTKIMRIGKLALYLGYQRRNNTDIAFPAVVGSIYRFEKVNISLLAPRCKLRMEEPFVVTFCAQQDRHLAVIVAVIQHIIDERPLGNKPDTAADKDKVFAFDLFDRIAPLPQRPANPDFVAGLSACESRL